LEVIDDQVFVNVEVSCIFSASCFAMGAILGADIRRHPLALFSLLLLFLEKWATLISSGCSLVEWLASCADIVAEIGWINISVSQRKRLLFTYLSFLIRHWRRDTLLETIHWIHLTIWVDTQLRKLDLPICHILQLNGCFAISFDVDTSSILHFPRKARVISDRTIVIVCMRFNEDLNR
jgi:hypothetical protein